MSLEYYIFCRDKYEEIILNLENIIENYNIIIDVTNSEENLEQNHYNIFQPETNQNFFMNRLTHMKQFQKICDNKIKKLCVHNFINDTIDINPERSDNITYCQYCGLTK